MLHDDITQEVIGAAMAVLNELKPGLDEKLYEKALAIELLARGQSVEQCTSTQRWVALFYLNMQWPHRNRVK